MIRLLAAAFAVVLSAAPVLIMPVPAVAVIALVGLLLATVGVAALWRWPVTAAACVFLADYAASLWVAAGPVNVAGAAGFGRRLSRARSSARISAAGAASAPPRSWRLPSRWRWRALSRRRCHPLSPRSSPPAAPSVS